MEFLHYSLLGLNSSRRVAYFDFAKAFDRVNHDILLRKLASFPIPLNIINWLKSYLSDRRQYVRIGGAESTDFIVNSSVPQGSHIGPTLFLLFINDLPSTISSEVFILMFADDIRIAKTINTSEDEFKLQSAIGNLREWCESNDLHLNLDKCSILSLHRGRHLPNPTYCYGDYRFTNTSEQRDLGVIIDNKLTFRSHTDLLVSKSKSALGFVKRFCRDITDVTTLKAVFFAFVQSNLDYSSSVWLTIPQSRSDEIESVLRQFTMFALKEYPNESNNFHISSFNNRLKRLGMAKLCRRRINYALLFLYDVLNDNIHCPFVRDLFYINANNRNFRNSELFKISDVNLMQNVPITLICKYANLVKHLFIESSSRLTFKKSLFQLSDDMFFV